jgi:hypothetical protein
MERFAIFREVFQVLVRIEVRIYLPHLSVFLRRSDLQPRSAFVVRGLAQITDRKSETPRWMACAIQPT